MERDLEIARDIQVSLFPRELPRIDRESSSSASAGPRRSSVGTSTTSSRSTAAGGRLALVLGDVSGKSIPASLLMVAAKEIVYARAMSDPDPAIVFREANRRIYEIKRRMFVSLAYFLFDPVALSLQYTFGGQPTPLLVRGGTGRRRRFRTRRTGSPRGAPGGAYDSRDALPVAGRPAPLLHRWPERGDVGRHDGLWRRAAQGVACPPRGRAAAGSWPRSFWRTSGSSRYGAEQYDDQTFVLMRVEEPGDRGSKPRAPGCVSWMRAVRSGEWFVCLSAAPPRPIALGGLLTAGVARAYSYLGRGGR